MIALLAAIAIGQTPATDLTGSQIFSKMLAKYHDAKSVRGTVTLTQTAMDNKGGTQILTIITSIQTSAPNQFFIEQTRRPANPDADVITHFVGVSDGKKMGYTVRRDMLPWTGTATRSGQMYEAAPANIEGALNAFSTLLPDRSLPVAVALYNPYEVQLVTKHLTNLVANKNADENGPYFVKADLIRYAKAGDSKQAVKTGTADIVIDRSFNLLSIGWSDLFTDKVAGTFKIASLWRVNLTVDGEVDKALFTVR